MSDIYIVQTTSSFRIRYAVRADSQEKAVEYVMAGEEVDKVFYEMSQEHKGETVDDVMVVSEERYLEMFDEDNDYLKSWTKEQKLDLIHEL